MNELFIYLDHNATTQPLPSAVEAMLPFLTTCYANASSHIAAITGADVPHREAARRIARLLDAEPDEIAFTSGATESNNWVFDAIGHGPLGQVIISAVEHPSVTEPAMRLASRGFQILEIPVDQHGVVRISELVSRLTETTRLVSIMSANNEVGVLQPIQDLARIVRQRVPQSLFHTDATQSIGRVPISLSKSWDDVHLLSFSGHKFGAPKGIGGLFIRDGVHIPPLLLGGGQEHGLRAGTTNTPGLAGLAQAAKIATHVDVAAFTALRSNFEAELLLRFPHAIIHGVAASRLPNTTCFSIPGQHGPDLVEKLSTHGILIGTGSACSSGTLAPPKSLRAMGVSHEIAWAAVRISTSPATKFSDLQRFLDVLSAKI